MNIKWVGTLKNCENPLLCIFGKGKDVIVYFVLRKYEHHFFNTRKCTLAGYSRRRERFRVPLHSIKFEC